MSNCTNVWLPHYYRRSNRMDDSVNDYQSKNDCLQDAYSHGSYNAACVLGWFILLIVWDLSPWKHTWGICTRRSGALWEARSRLYRSRFLQSNTRWKALAEIYKICIPLHRSDRKISAKKTVRLFAKLNIEYSIFLRWFNLILLFFCEISMKFCRNFATNLRK